MPGPPSSRATVPPSEPRSSRPSFDHIDVGSGDPPARLQMVVALVLGLVLVAIPLYLWRRPRAESVAALGAGEARVEPFAPANPLPAADKTTLGEMKVLLCQDPGPKKTPPEQCDHVVEMETAFAKAIEESVGCMPKEAGGGTVIYVADVSFKRQAVSVATPKEGRTIKNVKAIGACQTAVKSRLEALALEAIPHAHARYKIATTATYPGAVQP